MSIQQPPSFAPGTAMFEEARRIINRMRPLGTGPTYKRAQKLAAETDRRRGLGLQFPKQRF